MGREGLQPVPCDGLCHGVHIAVDVVRDARLMPQQHVQPGAQPAEELDQHHPVLAGSWEEAGANVGVIQQGPARERVGCHLLVRSLRPALRCASIGSAGQLAELHGEVRLVQRSVVQQRTGVLGQLVQVVGKVGASAEAGQQCGTGVLARH